MKGQEKSSKTKKAIILSLCVVTLVFACKMIGLIGTIVPVINLSPEYFKTLIGSGTMESPFRAENVEP